MKKTGRTCSDMRAALTFYPIVIVLSSMLATAQSEPTPSSLGYTFPDEWEEHAGTMMILPARHSYGRELQALRREFRDIATAIAAHEPVHVFCYSADTAACKKLFADRMKNITIHSGDYRIDWARDHAPMVIRDAKGQLAAAGFRTNGWGKKYRGWRADVHTRDDIAKAMGWPIFLSDYVLEGGSIEISNRIGIVTESCVLHRNRTTWTKAEVEAEMKAMLGLDRIIWIKSGLMPDPITDGHVDGLLKWVAPGTVLLHTTDDRTDINYQICQDAKAVLKAEDLKVIELPLMDDMVHMNYYIGSGGQVAYVPLCGDPEQDEPALKIIRKLHPKVVTIEANAMAKAGGGIHCYTMQIPR